MTRCACTQASAPGQRAAQRRDAGGAARTSCRRQSEAARRRWWTRRQERRRRRDERRSRERKEGASARQPCNTPRREGRAAESTRSACGAWHRGTPDDTLRVHAGECCAASAQPSGKTSAERHAQPVGVRARRRTQMVDAKTGAKTKTRRETQQRALPKIISNYLPNYLS